jgi:hypothetical protein
MHFSYPVFPRKKYNIFGDTLRSASAGIAAVLSLIVVYRQKTDGLFGKAYAALAIGIMSRLLLLVTHNRITSCVSILISSRSGV